MNNILYLHETSKISGAENSIINLVKYLDKSKFTPIFILPEGGPLSSQLRGLGIEVNLIGFPSVRKCLGVPQTIKKILRIIKEKDIRIIHSHSIRTHIYGAIAARLSGIPVVWHQRNLITNEIIDPDRLFSFLPDKIICNSYAIARRFLSRGKLPEKVCVVYNGVDTVRFNPNISAGKVREEFGIRLNEVVVGIASRFSVVKGHETFFQAAKIILCDMPDRKDKPRFLVVGAAVFNEDQWREGYLKDMAKGLGIDDRVIFTGFREDMPQIYASLDILVLPSDAEACGRVILEAMASARPVIATNSGGTPEIIKDGIAGFLVEPGNPKALADKIASLANNITLAKNMGEASRKIIEESFRIEKNVEQIEGIYEGLMQDKK